MVNDALDSFCLTHNLKTEEWTIKHISELLKQLDVIMYNAKSKRTGQFTRYPYIDDEYANKSVYIFKLRGELKQLFENRQEKEIDLPYNDDIQYYNTNHAHTLEEIWKICRAGCGKTNDSFY